MPRGRGVVGQAAVELALALPVVVVLLLGMLQVALVGRDQLAVELAAREAARAAAVSADPAAAARSAADRANGVLVRVHGGVGQFRRFVQETVQLRRRKPDQ